MPKNIFFVVRLDKQTATALAQLAKQSGESRAVVVRGLLRQAAQVQNQEAPHA